MRWMAWLLLGAIAFYLVMLLPLFLAQRRLLYFPAPLGSPPAAFGLDAEVLELTTTRDERLVAWYRPAAEGKPLILFFHGNGGNLSNRAEIFRRFADEGWGYLAVDYRGYGASPGAPTEAGLLRDGEAAYAKALALGYPASRIVAFGESLGSGVAVPLAAEHLVGALVLDSAFSATVDIAAAQYWVFPVRLLMRDQYRSRDLIAHVDAPKLFLHASDDPVVPIGFDRALYALATPPKTFVEVPARAHIVADRAFENIRQWLESLPRP